MARNEAVGKAVYETAVDTNGLKKGLDDAGRTIKRTGTDVERAFAQQGTGALAKFRLGVDGIIGRFNTMAKGGGVGGAILGGVGLGAGLSVFSLVERGIGAVTDAITGASAAFREDQESQEKLKAALESNILSWDGNADAIERVIASRMRLGFSDDEQRDSLALLVAQVKDVNDALDIQRTAMDLVRLKGGTLADATTMLAKAYNGSATGLQRMGIQLGKGVDGMEAIAEVQKRASGQAEAWSKTSTGAAEAFNLKLGEIQERVGGFTDAAGRGFIDFLSGIVDVLDGPDGATAGLRDLSAQIYAVHQAAAAGGGETPIARMNREMQAWADTLKLQEFTGTPESFEWLQKLGPDTLRNFGAASAESLADVRALAQAFIDTKRPFSEFAMVIRQQVAPSFNVLTDAWTGSVKEIEDATESAGLTMDRALELMHAAVNDSIGGAMRTLDSQKEPWRQAWKEYAEYAKDPFKPKAFEEWLERRADKATENAAKAAKDGKPKVAQRWRELAAAMRNPVVGALVQIGLSVDEAIAAMATVEAAGKRLGTILPNILSVFGRDPTSGALRPGNNANGTANWRGGWTWVGERGPELMRLPQGTQIKSAEQSQRMAGGRIDVYVHDSDGGLARAGISTGSLASELGALLTSADRDAGARYTTVRR